MEKPNRAERRKDKFGGGRATDHGGWPTHEPNPAFHVDTPSEEPATPKAAGTDEPLTIVNRKPAARELA